MAINNPITIQEADGTTRVIQIIGVSDGYGIGLKANGKQTGTLFGDDIRVTRRAPSSSGKYCQGLPVYGVNYKIVGSGYWKIITDGAQLNGACGFGTGIDIDGKSYFSSKGLNRYQEGQLAYYLFTAAFKGIEDATGDFVALVGASLAGLEIDGQEGDIKEGYMFGWLRESGILKPVFRVYKRFGYTQYDCDSSLELASILSIFQLEVGYLGVHPAYLYRVNTSEGKQEPIKKIVFNQDITNVDDPNLAISAYVENKGNNTNIEVRNGSYQYGNYAERAFGDQSARQITDSYTIARIGSGSDTVVACYTISDKITMIKELNSTGILTGEFRNTLTNKLLKVSAAALSGSNKIISFKIYKVLKSKVVATFTTIVPNVNILERAVSSAIVSVDLTGATKLLELAGIGLGKNEDVRADEYILTPEFVFVLVVSSTGLINDFRYTLTTNDLF